MRKPEISFPLKAKLSSVLACWLVLAAASVCGLMACPSASAANSAKADPSAKRQPLYTFTLAHDGTPES